jgi:hypothetical protein
LRPVFCSHGIEWRRSFASINLRLPLYCAFAFYCLRLCFEACVKGLGFHFSSPTPSTPDLQDHLFFSGALSTKCVRENCPILVTARTPTSTPGSISEQALSGAFVHLCKLGQSDRLLRSVAKRFGVSHFAWAIRRMTPASSFLT